MKISYHTATDLLTMTKGYGKAGFGVVTSLQKLGHQVPFNDPTAPVQLSFVQPAWQKFHPNQYCIGYTPWESTELPSGWVDRMNNLDEVWATSTWTANVFAGNGVTKPIFVYPHGTDPAYTPVKREVKDKVKFLHVGEPALRKGAQMALDGFRRVFGNRDDVHLTIKCHHQNFLRQWGGGELKYVEDLYDNVTVINREYTEDEIRQLFYDHDVLVYPTYGEGFGLIPLQALASGMPTITTVDWAEYKKFIHMGVRARADRSIWSLHPGDVYYPNYEDLCGLMEHAADSNIGALHDIHYRQAAAIHEEYDWLKLTEKSFKHITEKNFLPSDS